MKVWAIVLAAMGGVLALAGSMAAGAPVAAPELAVKETVISPLPGSVDDIAFVGTADGKHVAFVGKENGVQHVYLDGVKLEDHAWIVANSVVLSPDGKRSGYIVQDSRDTSAVVVDGKVGDSYVDVLPDSLVFSADGQHFAYVAIFQKGTSNAVTKAPNFDSKVFAVLDGKPQKVYADVNPPEFKPDGTLTYRAVLRGEDAVVGSDLPVVKTGAGKAGQMVMVDGGQEGAVYDAIAPMRTIFSADSKRMVYVAIRGKMTMVVDNGIEGKLVDAVALPVVMSGDGKHLIYRVSENGKFTLVVDGKETVTFDDIELPVFTADGAHWGCEAWDKVGTAGGVMGAATGPITKMTFLEDGAVVETFDNTISNGCVFSADGKHWMLELQRAVGRADGNYSTNFSVVVDGVKGTTYDGMLVSSLSWSADSQHYAYTALKGESAVFIRDGVESALYDPMPSPGVFSPDGKHLAHFASRDKTLRLVIDGVESPEYDFLTGRKPMWVGNDVCEVLAVKDGNLVKIDATMP